MRIKVITKSVITCPLCGHKEEEEMPTNACQFVSSPKNKTDQK